MEARGSCLLFGRSLDQHKLRYIPFVGDGDSKSYTEVRKMAPYGRANYIPKEDCIAHVTKRMGTALRKLTTTHKGEQIFDSFWTDTGNSKRDYIIIFTCLLDCLYWCCKTI